MSAPALPAEIAHRAWHARLELRFEKRRGRTVIAHRRHHGPLMVQSAFYPEGAWCHAYVLHPPGGVAAGDALEIDVTVRGAAGALITTPAAGKFYRTAQATASQAQRLRVEGDGALEWLPQENIFFRGARSTIDTRVDLDPEARFIGCDVACFGRPASAEPFSEGRLETRFELYREGRPLLIERVCFEAGSPTLSALWGLGGHDTLGTLIAAPCEPHHLDRVREALGDAGGPAATLVDEVLLVRHLTDGARRCRPVLERCRAALRPLLLGRPAVMPRVWAT